MPATTQTTHPPTHPSRTGAAHPEAPASPDRRPAPWAAAPAREDVPSRPATVLDPELSAILRCPLTGGSLIPVDTDRLMSDRPFRDGVHPVYPVVNGIACLRPLH